MARLALKCTALLGLFIVCLVAAQETISPTLLNSKVSRSIEATTQLVQVNTEIEVENTGKSPINSYLVVLDAQLSDKQAFIVAKIKGEAEADLTVISTSVSGHSDKSFYRVDLGSSIEPGKKLIFHLEQVFTHALRPFPVEITQADNQLVVLEGNHYFYSPYKTNSQSTSVTLASNLIDSHSKLNPTSANDNSIKYGPYDNVEAFSQDKMRIHYQNNNPFLSVTSLERVIEVSHWGNIAVEETIDCKHIGAQLKGSFSRYDYQRMNTGIASIKSFKSVLPSSARDVYYRDEIGNISTSNLREEEDSVELELRPRFPLFGGWKTHYYIGYNVPSYEYLFTSGDNFVLKMRVLDHIFDNQAVDHLKLKIILPEGSKNVDIKVPFEVTTHPNQLHFTYLDTIGRPVLVVEKSNLVEQHIQDFEVHYTFQRRLLLQEPLLLVGAFYLLFATIILFVRLDFSISKDPVSEARLKVSGLIEQVLDAQDKRSGYCQQYDTAIDAFKSSKDTSAFGAARKRIDGEYKNFTGKLTALQTALKQENPEVSDKVQELQKLNTQIKETLQMAVINAEKIVNKKISKQQYMEMEKSNSAKRESLASKANSIVSSLY